MTLSFVRAGKLVKDAYIESFNGRFRDECLSSTCSCQYATSSD
ncbi:integrase core domain-containing protein [Burkholderia cepacia]